MKHLVGLTLLIAPWLIFLYFALQRGATSTFAIVATIAASAFGLMILIGRKPKQ